MVLLRQKAAGNQVACLKFDYPIRKVNTRNVAVDQSENTAGLRFPSGAGAGVRVFLVAARRLLVAGHPAKDQIQACYCIQ